jgi:ABC-type dipeptide/oligopeptide/nickel transport system ATPase component
VALLGESGAGKSTLAAYLLSQGAQIVTDDMLRLSEIDGGCFAEPGQPRIKLFRHDAERLLPQALELGHWNAYSDKYIFLPQDPTERRECTRLDALIFLADPVLSDDRKLHMERTRGAAAFELLTASTMNRSFRTPERFRTQLAFAAKVAARAPLYTLNYTRDYNLLHAVSEHIDATLALDLS